MSTRSVSIDIGGTKIAAAIVDSHGRLGARYQTTTPKTGADDVIGSVLDVARQALTDADGEIAVCGIGSAGVIGPDGSVTSATDLIPGWAGTPLAARVSAALNLPTHAINDVHATGIAEARIGAAAGANPTVLMAIGTGIGGAIIVDGEVLIGAHGVAGAVGHIPVTGAATSRVCSCGVSDHIEPHASGPGLERSYAELTGSSAPVSLRSVAALARDGDQVALEVFHTGGRLIGQSLATCANTIDPVRIVIGGGVSAVTDLLLPGIRIGLADAGLGPVRDVDVVPAQLGSDACMVGSGLHAIGQRETR